jgi:PAS domain S-box-containing protein
MTRIADLRISDIISRDVQTIAPSSTLWAAAGLMARARVSSLVVTSADAKALGILSAGDLVRLQARGVTFSTRVSEVVDGTPMSMPIGQDLRSAYVMLRRAGVTQMLADADGRLAGLVSETDVCRHLSAEGLGRAGDLGSLIERDIPRLGLGSSLGEALAAMARDGRGLILVMGSERLLGTLSERDLPELLAQKKDVSALPLGEVMRAPPVTIPRDRLNAEALELMDRSRIEHLPVLEADGALLGVLTRARMLECVGFELLEESIEEESVLSRASSESESRLELRRMHAILDALVEGATDAIFVKDQSGTCVLANGAMARLIGRPINELVGRDDFGLFPAELAERYRADDRRIMSTGVTETYEEPVVTPAGTFEFLTTKGPLVVNGEVRGIFGIARDITARKHAEEALRQSEARLDLAQRIAGVGHWQIDPRGHVLIWSDEMYRLTGLDPTGGPPSWKTYLDWVHPEDRARVREAQSEVLRTGKPTQTEFRNNPAKGPKHHFVHRVEAELDSKGRVTRLVGTCQDVTELWRAEAEARQRGAVLESVFRAIPDLFFLMDGDGTIRDYRAQRPSDLYAPPEQFLGKRVQDVAPPQIAEAFEQQLRAARSQAGVVSFEYTLPLHGSERRYEARLSRLEGDGRCVAMVRDITEQHQARQVLAESERRYALAAAIGRSAAWEMWPVKGRLFFDDNLPRVMGYDKGDLSEALEDWLRIIPDHARAGFEAALETVAEGRSHRFDLEHPVCRKDGSVGWAHVTGERVSAPGEEPLRLIGSSMDITERKHGESERETQLGELRRWHEAMLGRESRILELKGEINTLLAELGRPPRYRSVADTTDDPAGD